MGSKLCKHCLKICIFPIKIFVYTVSMLQQHLRNENIILKLGSILKLWNSTFYYLKQNQNQKQKDKSKYWTIKHLLIGI